MDHDIVDKDIVVIQYTSLIQLHESYEQYTDYNEIVIQTALALCTFFL